MCLPFIQDIIVFIYFCLMSIGRENCQGIMLHGRHSLDRENLFFQWGPIFVNSLTMVSWEILWAGAVQQDQNQRKA